MAPQQHDKVYVVTGGLGSIGTAISTELARTGGTVILLVRNLDRAVGPLREIRTTTGNDRVEALACDLGAMASIRRAADVLTGRFSKIDVLINNAAAFSSTRRETHDGFELQFGTNHLAAFLLTNLLAGPLKAARGRVINMTMPAKNPLLWEDLMLERKYDGMRAYGMSKAANLYFTRELAQRWEGQVSVNAVDPGMVKTTLIREAPLPIRLIFALAAVAPQKGAQTAVYAATAPEAGELTGHLLKNNKPCAFPKGSEDRQACRRLWDVSARLVQLSAA